MTRKSTENSIGAGHWRSGSGSGPVRLPGRWWRQRLRFERVPADVSIVGSDDIELSRHVEPRLSTVHQPVRRKGDEACRLLLSAIARDDSSWPDHRRLEPRLIVRGSSGPAPNGKEVAGGC